MIRFILLLLSFSPACIAAPTNQLIILTTFTESSITPITDKFQQHYPDTSIKVLHRREESGLRLLEKNDHDIDIVVSSSRSLFLPLIEQNRLLPLNDVNRKSDAQQLNFQQDYPDYLAIFGYSGYGLMWNKDYLAKQRLDIPTAWENLAQPQYYRHLIMSSPARSGTTHLMVENILQRYGWNEGWKLLLQIGGNLSSLSARSFGVSEAVSRGLAGIGPVIDSFAYESQKQFPFIGFNYQMHSPLLPSYIAAVKNINQAKHSQQFIKYLLSEHVQQTLSTSSLNKYGLHQKTRQHYSVLPLDHNLMQHRATLIKQLFEQSINHQLILLNQAWQLIHRIGKLNHLSDDQRRLYNQAIKLASTPPVTKEQADSDAYLQALTRSRTDVDTAKRLNNWRQTMSTQLETSIAISERIITSAKEAE
ncbi:extracellular solute-binding protein [Photobacterium sp. SDRW27]|uniref:ABC transporter substrate-binding protein n=1 Tax=Photobacterium obscurum TaxID=2829490 RepID=UPI002244CBE9|nr:extracellular solute-binding protein [Photobacterium obscurum]MCW8331614.1 extracellular solute-binding protein [Photobacterium obscurum]